MNGSGQNDLRNRILFTIFILAIYRLGTFVPLPGIDPAQLQTLMEGNQKGLLGMFNVFAGGAISEWQFCARYHAIYFIINYCTIANWRI